VSPRAFHKFMVDEEIGRNLKLARLTHTERWCHVAGVLAIASKSPIRGCLLLGEERAETFDIAKQADVPLKVAASAMTKLRDLGVLCWDDEYGCERVHDWDDWNPAPKRDATAAERQRRRRDRLRQEAANRNGHANVTPLSRTASRLRHAPEVEVEGEELPSGPTSKVVGERSVGPHREGVGS
jgi:hypothetical protein